jgi:hypothetical protein
MLRVGMATGFPLVPASRMTVRGKIQMDLLQGEGIGTKGFCLSLAGMPRVPGDYG